MASTPVAPWRAPPFMNPPGHVLHRPEETLLYPLIGPHCPGFLPRAKRPAGRCCSTCAISPVEAHPISRVGEHLVRSLAEQEATILTRPVQAEGLDLLKNYDVLITGHHPEYQTAQQLDAYEAYIRQGGHLMYIGGNGYYWRIALNELTPGVIEVRRGRVGTSGWQSEVGESCLALTGEMGGLWRESGRPPQRLLGVGFIGYGPGASYYRVLPEARNSRAAFILNGVEGDIIGDFGIFEGGAAGQEIDKTYAGRGTPDNLVVLARSENHGPNMTYVIEERAGIEMGIDYHSLTYAEVTLFETPKGGSVFSVGSMGWCGGLSHNGYNNNVSTMTANVINRHLRLPSSTVNRGDGSAPSHRERNPA